MPCFLTGKCAASMVSLTHGVPLYETSHQMGHILAALYSAGKLSWTEPGARPFLAFHVSGGTTDLVRCTPDPETVLQIRQVASSLDLKAGQAVDRVGLMLGLQFPCGPALVKLKDGCCSLSGLQNQCEQMLKKGESAPDIAGYCLNSIAAVLAAMTKAAASDGSAVLYAGGVLSDRLIQQKLQVLPVQTAFAAPEYSCDNAAGIAVFAARRAQLCQY